MRILHNLPGSRLFVDRLKNALDGHASRLFPFPSRETFGDALIDMR